MIGPIPAPPPPPPPGGMTSPSGSASLPPPLPGQVAGETGPIAPPPPPGMDRELQVQLEGLKRQVHLGRRRSFLLANGAAAAVLLGIVCWAIYYATTVLSFAKLDPAIEIRRDPADRDRLALVYRPMSRGRVGFRRADVDRQTELLDRVLADAVGKPQTFEWRVANLKPGDTVRVTFREGLRLVTRDVPVPGGAEASSARATLTGQIVNAVDNRPVAGAEVRVVGASLSTQTDARGEFRLHQSPAGPVTVEVSAPGFSKEFFERELIADRANALRAVLNPGMEAGQIRIVLTWDRVPADLDAHLEGPLPGDKRFHVYYHQQGDLTSKEFVRLDVDDQDGQGPETITVLGVLPGTYKYFVHDYTNRNSPRSVALANSGAEVRVYQGGQTYRFRAGHDRVGNVWNVCRIEVTPKGAVVAKVDTYESPNLGLYAKRTMANRLEWLPALGGSAESEKAVELGLAWLARHQAEDGSWGNYCLGGGSRSRCQAASPCTGPGGLYEMAHTGLALLALQAGGHYDDNGNLYSPQVRKGLDWLVAHQRPDGGLIGSQTKGERDFNRAYMYEHGIATFALGEACAVDGSDSRRRDRYLDALRKALGFLYRMQHDDGGWRYNANLKEASDTSVVGWQVLALKTAKEAGLPLDTGRVARVRRFFEARATDNGRTGYLDRNPHTEATTGVGMLARQFLFGEPDAPLVRDAAAYLAGYAESRWSDPAARKREKDFYLWYNGTLAMFQAGGEPWKRWNGVVRDTVIDLQRRDGCMQGSWDPNSKWGDSGGRIYTTALATLILEVYYRYTSIEEPGALEPAGARRP